ncbi:MAG TPA: hypothetical protein VME67_26270 [Mycobacterium sp.]|nr:hypothetical protein [Mycobacterium sp.]HTX98024.1 hypothetical protein [Mycobacterium sp.]
MTNDALVSVGRITAQGTSDVVNQLPLWVQEIQAVAAVATTIGVLIALYVAIVREPRKAAEERKHHKARFDALRRAQGKRVAAQARKVFPSSIRTPMFGDSWWTVRIDNTSNAVTTILAVEVKAIDTKGFEVPDGCEQANNTVPLDQAFDRSILAALSTFTGASEQRSSLLPPTFKQALRDALVGHFATAWDRTLSPNQHAVMAYRTTKPDYTLRVTVDYEDQAGYQRRRTDSSQPERISTEPLLSRQR